MLRNIYQVKISGRDVRRFIKKLYNSSIYIEEIELYNKYAYLKLTKDNYEKLKEIKTIYKVEVVRLYGFIKIFDIIKRHLIFIIVLFFGYIYLLFLSNLIFRVEIIHSNKEIRDLIKNELKYYDISPYKLVKSYSYKEKVRNKILNKYKDKLEWIEINRIGTKYEIRIEERIIKKGTTKTTPRDIVAKRDGIIKKIEARKGEVRRKVNDYIKKGDVIISGVITKKDEVKNIISSEGEVFGETWYKTSINMPFYYKEVNSTGKKNNVLKLKIFNKDIYFLNFNKYKTYKEKKYFKFKNRLLPIGIYFSKEFETNVIERLYSYDEAVDESIKISREKIESNLKSNEKILKEKVLNVVEYENYINVSIFYKVYENITDYKDIDINKINEEIKKDLKQSN